MKPKFAPPPLPTPRSPISALMGTQSTTPVSASEAPAPSVVAQQSEPAATEDALPTQPNDVSHRPHRPARRSTAGERSAQAYEPRTFRLGRDEIEILETVRMARRRSVRATRGLADYSALVREAIRGYFKNR